MDIQNPRLPPSMTDKYEVLGKLGEGGMGSIYKIRHRMLKEIRVLKVIREGLQDHFDANARFQREARLATTLKHPNLIRVLDYEAASEYPAYAVFEYFEGRTIRALKRETTDPLPVGYALDIARQLLAALSYLHSRGIVHRDLAPSNALVRTGNDGRPLVKLIDLGVARRLGDAEQLTSPGSFLGRVRYASPEHFKRDSATIGPTSDVYSVGVVISELLTGELPISGTDVSSLVGGHLRRPPRPFSETDPTHRLVEPVRIALLRALAKNPEERPQSAFEFWQELRIAYVEGTVRRSTSTRFVLGRRPAILASLVQWRPKPRGAAAGIATL